MTCTEDLDFRIQRVRKVPLQFSEITVLFNFLHDVLISEYSVSVNLLYNFRNSAV